MKRLLPAGILLLFLLGSALVAQETKENADFKLAVNLYNDKLYDLALEQLQQFVNSYPNTPQGVEARFYLGLTQMRLERFDEARFTFQNFALAFPEHPRAPEAWWNVAEAYASLGNAKDAALSFERVKTFHPRSAMAPQALLKAGEYHRRAGDSTNAIRVLRTLTQDYTSPEEVASARLALTELHLDRKEHELARAEARRVSEGSTSPALVPRALLLLGTAEWELGQLEQALDALSRLAREYPGAPAAPRGRLLKGLVHRDLGEIERAEETWTVLAAESAKVEPAVRQEALLDLADLYERLGSDRRALDACQRGARLEGSLKGELLFRAGKLAERLGNKEQAGRFYVSAVGDTSQRGASPILSAGAFRGALLLRDYHLAARLAHRFRLEFPNHPLLPRVLLEYARILRSDLGDPRRAVDLLDEIIDRFPESAFVDDAFLEKGLALKASGNLDDARVIFDGLADRYHASELVPRAKDQSKRISLFEAKERAAGTENLAMLMGEVIEDRSRAELAFRLGEIFFNDLKDYSRAAEQYRRALSLGLDKTGRGRALLRQGQCFEYLAWREQIDGSEGFRTHAVRSISAYDSLLKGSEPSPEMDTARLSRLQLRLQLARNVTDIARASDDAGGGFRFAPQAWLDIGDAYRRMNENNRALAAYDRASDASAPDDVEATALFRKAQLLTETGRGDSARTLLESCRRQYPLQRDAPQVLSLLARQYASSGRSSDALRLCEELEQRYFYSSVAVENDLQQAEAFYAGNDVAAAIHYFERWNRRAETDVFFTGRLPLTSLLHLAVSYDRLGSTPQAKESYRQLLTRDTSAFVRATALYALAEIAKKEKNIDLATRYLEDAGRLGSPAGASRNPALEAADLLLQSEQYATALQKYQEVARTVTADSLKQYVESRIILCQFRLDNLKDADQRAAAYAKRYPKATEEAAEFEYERGRYHLRREELDQALRRFENTVSRYPRARIRPEATYWIARIYEMQNKVQEAVALYDSLLKKYPDHAIAPRLRLSLGNAYYTLEQWDPAGRLYKALVDSEARAPDLVPYAMSNLIMTYKEMQLYDAALQLTRTYIVRFPDDPDLMGKRIDIGVLLQKLGYYDQSILHLQSLLANADADLEAELRYYIGEAYYYKGDHQQAVLEFLKVPYLVTRRTKADWIAPSYYMAGQSYEKMSKFDQAINMYQQVIDRPGIDPTFKSAAQKEIDRVTAMVKPK